LAKKDFKKNGSDWPLNETLRKVDERRLSRKNTQVKLNGQGGLNFEIHYTAISKF
jgi:hypothetical protein